MSTQKTVKWIYQGHDENGRIMGCFQEVDVPPRRFKNTRTRAQRRKVKRARRERK